MKFNEMPYERPDKNETVKSISALTERFRAAADFADADRVFLEADRYFRHLYTQMNLAYIRHSIDTRDAFYNEEEKFWNGARPEIEEYCQLWTQALLASPFRADFEAKYGEIVFLNAEISQKAFAPVNIPLMQEENDLTQEYEKLLASAQIPFKGGVYTLSQLAPYKETDDDAVRLAAWKAEGGWYKAHQEKLDGIYDRLVALRHEIAKNMEYADFTEVGYYRMMRNCYSKADVAKFRDAVVKYLVPVADRIRRAQAQRLGVKYPMSFADCALMFRSGNPVPVGDADDIVQNAKAFYDALSPETSAFFNKMLEDELMHLLSTEGKQAGGYCESIYEYDVPFIFANFNGTRDDVETLTHEGGHAFAGWLNRDRVPLETIWPSLEACEVHSMSMEFFGWLAADRFFGPDALKFKYAHLAGAVTFIPYGTMVDHFQHTVYEHPELTPAERHAEWKRLLGIYMPWLRLDGDIPFYAEGMGWQRQHHIYSSPFYYIDYCLAQTVALSFWAAIREDREDAWARYLAYTKLGGSKVFTQLLAHAGIGSPFDEACLRSVCEAAAAWLDRFSEDKLQ